MASTIFFITSLLLTITSVTAIDTTTKPTTSTTTAIHFPTTLLLPISTDLKNPPLNFGFFRPSVVPILVSASVGAAYLSDRMVLNLVLGLSSLHIAILCFLKGIFGILGGIVVLHEVLGGGTRKITINIPLTNTAVRQVRERRRKQKINKEEDKDGKKDEKGGGGGDKGEDPEDGENEWVDVTVEIRKYLTETDESKGVLIEEVPIDDCTSWTILANRIHEAWMSIDWEEDDAVVENVDPDNCWPGYEVSYWSAEKKRINWNQVKWVHAKHKLALVRLVPLRYPFLKSSLVLVSK